MFDHEPNPLRCHPLAAFFVLVYAISWGLSLFAARGVLPFAVPPVVALAGGLLYHFGPALAGIAVAAALAGRAGVKGLLRPLGRWRVGIGWYLFIALYPLVLRLTAVGLGRIFGGPAPVLFDSHSLGLPAGNPLALALPVFLSTLILTGVAEEIGWRGFALPRLQDRFSALVSSLILAALWAPWHYNPLNYPGIRAVIPWHIPAVLAMTILMTWVYDNTGGSLLIAVLFHAFSNFSDWVIPTAPAALGGSAAALTVQVGLNLAVALAVVLVFGAEDFSRRPEGRMKTDREVRNGTETVG
jgi:membrane protease YdiL (CAAX protease family)